MEDIVEDKIGDLTVRIDRLLCVGFGDCIEEAPEIFEFDDEGICAFREGGEGVERERVIHACEVCPVDALIVLDQAGEQLVP